jgi:hypothetical protein
MSTTAVDVDSRERAPSELGVLDLAQYTLEQVRMDGELVLSRGLRSGPGPSRSCRIMAAQW